MKALAISFASLVMRLVTWWWERTSAAWSHAYGEPMLELRLLYLLIAAIVSVVLIPVAFKDMGIVGGISYLFALFMATSNATIFRMVRIGRAKYIPLGAIAPVAIFVGIVASRAIRPLLGDAKDSAFAGDFVSAIIILGVFLFLTLIFRQWQSGNPYGS